MVLCVFFYRMDALSKARQHSKLKNSFKNMLSKIINVCEHLFEELVKE